MLQRIQASQQGCHLTFMWQYRNTICALCKLSTSTLLKWLCYSDISNVMVVFFDLSLDQNGQKLVKNSIQGLIAFSITTLRSVFYNPISKFYTLLSLYVLLWS